MAIRVQQLRHRILGVGTNQAQAQAELVPLYAADGAPYVALPPGGFWDESPVPAGNPLDGAQQARSRGYYPPPQTESRRWGIPH